MQNKITLAKVGETAAGDGAPAACEDAPDAGGAAAVIADVSLVRASDGSASPTKVALAEFFGEGDPSNTPSQKTTVGGEDYLKVHLYLNHGDFAALSKRLNEAREAALMDKRGQDELQLGEFRFIVKPAGILEGDVTKGLRLRWRLLGENGIWLFLGNRENAHHTQPNAAIQVGSVSLMQFGTKAVWGMVEHVLDAIGVTLVKNKLSRVDACVDLPGAPVEEVVAAFRARYYITRAHHRADYGVELPIASYDHGTKPTGFTVGKSPMLVRAYEKLRETKNDPTKRALLIANRWGEVPECATRVEMQVGRERLKTYGVDSFEDWLEKRGAICKTVMENWLRLTVGLVDRKHAYRSATHPRWIQATEAFASWCGATTCVELTPLCKIEIDVSCRLSTALGIVKNSFARSGKDIQDNEHFMREMRAAILDAIGERDMAEEVRRKTLELAAA
jgi:hypothetical protein